MTDDVSYALTTLRTIEARYGAGPEQWTLFDGRDRVHGEPRDALRASLRNAEFVLNVGDLNWFDDLELCNAAS